MIRPAIVCLLAIVIPLGTASGQWDAPTDQGEAKAPDVAMEPYDDPDVPRSEHGPAAAGTVFPPGPQPGQPAPRPDREPPSLRHERPAGHEKGRPLGLVVNAVDRSGIDRVTLHWRAAGKDAYQSMAMRVGAVGLHEAELPPSATGGMWLDYYVEAVDRLGNGPALLGSAEEPLRVPLHQPPSAASASLSRLGVGVGFLAACFILASVVLKLRDRAERARVEDQIFWTRTLLPLLGLRGTPFTEAVTRLTKQPLVHPAHGVRRYTRAVILKQLERVRHMRLDRVADRAEKYSAEVPTPRATAPEARHRTGPPQRQRKAEEAREPAGVW